MNTNASQVREGLERLQPDVHSCLVYETREEQFAAAVPFIQLGLERGEKCVYVCDGNSTTEVLQALRGGGIETDPAIQSGALTLVLKRAASQGSNGPDGMLSFLKRVNDSVAAGGFSALRVASEMSWKPGESSSQKELAIYESQLESCFPGRKYVDICQYSSRRFPPDILLHAIRSHPVVIWNGTVCTNLHSRPPEERLAPDPTPQEVERVLVNLRERQFIEDGLRKQCEAAATVPVETLVSGGSSALATSGCRTCLTQISNLQSQLQQIHKMEALGRMASGVAHEFRNFLTIILGCTEILTKHLAADDRGRDLANRIFRAGQNASELANQLLAFSRPQEIRAEVTDLNATVAGLDGVLRCLLRKNIELRLVAAPDPCPACIDVRQLEQALVNLVMNACDAMAEGGSITIQLANANISAEEAAGQPGLHSGRYVTLAVCDTGAGMDEQTRRRVFEPFFTTKKPGEGTGLGLAIVYGIVHKQFGGSISVASSVGSGTTFTLYLPRCENPD